MYTDFSVPTLHELLPLLTSAWKKGEPNQFKDLSTEEVYALSKLKPNLIATPLLELPRSENYLTLYTDAWDKQIGWYWCGISKMEPKPL